MMVKKCLALILSMALCVAFITVPAFAAGAEDGAIIAIDEIKYREGSENIYTLKTGDIKSEVFVTNEGNEAKDVIVAAAVYADDTLSDVSFVKKSVPAGAKREKLSTEAVEVKSASDTYRTFVWEANGKPLCKDFTFGSKSTAKEIDSFSVEIGGKVFEGNVNKDKNEIEVYVPTMYTVYQTTAYLGLDSKYADWVGGVTPDIFDAAIAQAITPTIEGKGTIAGKSEAKDFSAPVEYEITAEDGTKTTYTVKVNKADTRFYVGADHAKASVDSTGLIETKSNTNCIGQGAHLMWYPQAPQGGYSAVLTSDATRTWKLTKTDASVNTDIVAYAPIQARYFGFVQDNVVDVTMKLDDLSEGNGFVMSYFSTDQDTSRNANLIFKKGTVDGTADLYWSRRGTGNPVKIEEAAPFTLGELHEVKVIRVMDPEMLPDGNFRGTVELYIDGEFVTSFTDYNYWSFNGGEKSVVSSNVSEASRNHNGSYNHVKMGSVTNDVLENGGTTYTLDIAKIDTHSVRYGEDVISGELSDFSLTVDGKKYNALCKDGVYTFTVPEDADLTGVTPSVKARSQYATVTVSGSLDDEAGMTVTTSNPLMTWAGVAAATYTVKVNRMTHLVDANFTAALTDNTNIQDAAPDGFNFVTNDTSFASIASDPFDSANTVLKIQKKSTRDWKYFMMSQASNPINRTNGFEVSYKMYVESASATSDGPVLHMYTQGNSLQSPCIDLAAVKNNTSMYYLNHRCAKDTVYLTADAASKSSPNAYTVFKSPDSSEVLYANSGEWIDITYSFNYSSDTESHPNGYYMDIYVNGILRDTVTEPLRLANAHLGGASELHGDITNPFMICRGDSTRTGTIYIDDITVYYNPAE